MAAMATASEVKRRRISEQAARDYVRTRDPRRYRRTGLEETFVRGWLSQLPANAVVFDCPCGTGRFVNTAVALGLRYVGADYSLTMIAEARRVSASRQVAGFCSGDAERLPLKDNSVDCVMLWRLLHHIVNPAVRQQMLREAARVSRGMVLVSFHHPLSFTFARRLVRRFFTGNWEIADITHWRLAREASECGLRMVETKSFGKYSSINWFARLQKVACP
jgi:ubiquinone/menaquinone biosynthesis C-methylase UbiE